jgi:uncharacterized protein (UPF0276 family)
MYSDLPHLGAGLGYRRPFHEPLHARPAAVDFLEIVSDQYLYASPEKLTALDELRATWPLVLHGVGLSIGTATRLDADYLHRLGRLVERTRVPWFSDHLSFTKVPEIDIQQLTPLWFTEESLDAVCRNVRQVQAAIDRPFLLENITYYFPMPDNDMTEAEFTTRVLEETDIGLLLDVNNVWVNSINHGFDPYEFLAGIPLERTVEIHIAGGRQVRDVVVDSHSAPVREEVWSLLGHVLERVPVRAVLLEWDDDWPEFAVLTQHLERARRLWPARVTR